MSRSGYFPLENIVHVDPYAAQGSNPGLADPSHPYATQASNPRPARRVPGRTAMAGLLLTRLRLASDRLFSVRRVRAFVLELATGRLDDLFLTGDIDHVYPQAASFCRYAQSLASFGLPNPNLSPNLSPNPSYNPNPSQVCTPAPLRWTGRGARRGHRDPQVRDRVRTRIRVSVRVASAPLGQHDAVHTQIGRSGRVATCGYV